ncbi:unnamed protein product [Orchesella dallaii]|uniref:Uncharacterized protein n=1 Tax=Orchesella dallaii TaxID=48710 RepID=A0ABP1Q356_9HEXA
MKVAVAFALVAACVAATYSAPITFAPDYAAVGAKVQEVRAVVSAAVNQIKTIANNDNAAVGSDISSQLDAAAVRATEVLGRAQAAIDAQSLTVAQAEGLFTELKDILAGIQSDLQDELAQLSTGAAGQIRDQFYGAYAQAEALAQEIYALLAAKSGVFAPDYAAVGRKVEEVRAVVSAAVNQIKTIANNDNAAVGSDISSQLDAAAVRATEVLGRAQAAIEAQSLTVAQAEGLFTELKDILAGIQNDLQDELAQLSTGAAGQIRDQFYGAYAQAEALAQEIYALLAARLGVFAPDYAAVGRKVEEVRAVVSAAVNQIKTIANNDNAAVGSDISSQLDAAAVRATEVLGRAQAAIEAQSLTVAQAEGLFTELKDILAGIQSDLADELAQLSAGASGQIRDQFYGAYAQAEALAQEIYALLAAKSGVFAPDYAAVGRKVEEVRAVVSAAVNQIKTIANNDNAAVGSDISSQLDAAAVRATEVLGRAQAAIEAQSLTVAQAEGLFTELKDILAGIQSDLADELAQLSTGASGQIRDQFYGAYAQAEALAQEIYALLAQ